MSHLGKLHTTRAHLTGRLAVPNALRIGAVRKQRLHHVSIAEFQSDKVR